MTSRAFYFVLAAAFGAPTFAVPWAVRAQAPPAKTSNVVKATARPVEKPKVLGPPKAVPNIKLAIETPTTRGAWTMRIVNAGEVPVRVVADARLLTLDVTPRSARASTRCELPSDMRPSDDLDRALVVPGGRSYSESFEPRLYCFGGKLDLLAPGAIVVARLGWMSTRKNDPPFEVAPIDGVEPELAPLKSIDGAPVALPDEPSSDVVQAAPSGHDLDPDASRLSLRGPTSIDAVTPNDIEISVTLRNDGSRSKVVRFRPDVLGFDVVSPASVEHCAWPRTPAAAMRELFMTLAPKQSESLNVTLGSYCTQQSLDQAGLLVVRPRLDTRNASGIDVGLHSFDGEVIGLTPTVIRLHRGAMPQPMVRPRLEPP